MGADLAAQLADFLALRLGQVGGRGAFHHLLVAALDRAIALIKVIDVALLVAEDLHLDVTGAGDHLFKIALAVSKGGLGLAPAFQHLVLQLLGAFDRAHAATAAPPGRLEHQGIADLLGLLRDLVEIVAQNLGGGNHRHTGLNRHLAGAGLVTKGAHGFGLGTDKGDAGGSAGVHEIGVFRQQAIPRVDRICARGLGNADDLFDRQIGLNGAKPFADAIGLIRLEAVQPQLVFLREDGHRLLPHLVRRTHDADRDLAPVGYQDLFKICHVSRVLLRHSRAILRNIITLRVCRDAAQEGFANYSCATVAFANSVFPRRSAGRDTPSWPILATRSRRRISARWAGPGAPRAQTA